MLTDKECKSAACPSDKKRARFTDSNGLYLEVSPTGSKRWFWKTYFDGKESRIALGSYPSVSLTEARKARDRVKLQKADGVNPIEARRVTRLVKETTLGETFKEIAQDWLSRQKSVWSPGHFQRMERQFERDLFPWIGGRNLSEIKPVELLSVLRKIESRGALETADRALMLARQVWCYGVATGKVDRDITGDLKDALTPYRGKHFAAITEPSELGELLLAIDHYRGGPIVKAALRLAPLLFQRPGELRATAWSEVDMDVALWTIPAARMKRGVEGKEYGPPHVVPLSKQALEIFRELHKLTGGNKLVFPGERNHDRPISENSVRTALISMGYTPDIHTWHGFRATARTMLAEQLEFDPLVIEAQLAHAVKDANGRAYNRTQYLAQRTKMMQSWADYLDRLRHAPKSKTRTKPR